MRPLKTKGTRGCPETMQNRNAKSLPEKEERRKKKKERGRGQSSSTPRSRGAKGAEQSGRSLGFGAGPSRRRGGAAGPDPLATRPLTCGASCPGDPCSAVLDRPGRPTPELASEPSGARVLHRGSVGWTGPGETNCHGLCDCCFTSQRPPQLERPAPSLSLSFPRSGPTPCEPAFVR